MLLKLHNLTIFPHESSPVEVTAFTSSNSETCQTALRTLKHLLHVWVCLGELVENENMISANNLPRAAGSRK